jgi:hypothetical protein
MIREDPALKKSADRHQLVSFLRNALHNFRLLPGAGGKSAGLAKMRRPFLRGPTGHLLYGVDGSHFAVYLQALVQRARVTLRRKGDGCVTLHFPPILAAPTVLSPRLHVWTFPCYFWDTTPKTGDEWLIVVFGKKGVDRDLELTEPIL